MIQRRRICLNVPCVKNICRIGLQSLDSLALLSQKRASELRWSEKKEVSASNYEVPVSTIYSKRLFA